MRVILLIVLAGLCGCSTSNIYVTPPAGSGDLTITVNQPHKGWDSVIPLEGVQANIPMQGGTVTNPTNAPVLK